jgi:esterase/lipase
MKLTSGICVPELNKMAVVMAVVMDEIIAEKLSTYFSDETSTKFDENTFTFDETSKRTMLEYTAKKLTTKKQIKKFERAIKVKKKFLDLHKIEDETISGYKTQSKPSNVNSLSFAHL